MVHVCFHKWAFVARSYVCIDYRARPQKCLGWQPHPWANFAIGVVVVSHIKEQAAPNSKGNTNRAM